MEITNIPFAQTVGLVKGADGVLKFNYDEALFNHLQTIAAGAQYSLAELASGDHLLSLFPELVEKVIPVLRNSQLKYKSPAATSISAHPSVSDKAVAKFRKQLEKKGRALITINVDIKDTAGVITSSGSFLWYVTKDDGGVER